jgi:hypothetical protein
LSKIPAATGCGLRFLHGFFLHGPFFHGLFHCLLFHGLLLLHRGGLLHEVTTGVNGTIIVIVELVVVVRRLGGVVGILGSVVRVVTPNVHRQIDGFVANIVVTKIIHSTQMPMTPRNINFTKMMPNRTIESCL